MILFIEQLFNGLQLGVTLFLLASGLTLVFGIMGLINLSHGSLYMVGAYVAATVAGYSGSFLMGMLAALAVAAILGVAIEKLVMRHLYERDHLYQVLATFGLILFFNEAVRLVWGSQPLFMDIPVALDFTVQIFGEAAYPAYRIAIIVIGALVLAVLYVLIFYTKIGMLTRAGSSNREMAQALGVNIDRLYTGIFAFGAVLSALAGALVGPIYAVEIGMGEHILIFAFVVIVIGGIGSIKGSFVAALIIGIVDTLGRAYLPAFFKTFMSASDGAMVGSSLASIAIYLLMAGILVFRPRGLFTKL
jgi:branched-chain amino acid transport system permease protein